MPIMVTDADVDRRLAALLPLQPVRGSKAALATAMLDAALAACERSGDPQAWRSQIGDQSAPSPTVTAQTDTSQPRVDPAQPTTAAPKGADRNSRRATGAPAR